MAQNWNQDVYLTAWHFATTAHSNQTYLGSLEGERVPYLAHLGSVVMEVISALNTDADLNGNLAIQCALLHDTIEDTDVNFATLETHFGLDVAKGVLALTKNIKFPTKREQMLDSLNRIIVQPKEIWMVKLADRISNLRLAPFLWTNEKRHAYREEALIIHAYLHDANKLLSQRLTTKIEIYKKYIQAVD